MTDTKPDLEAISAVRADYGHCFGCGPDNAIGLNIDDFVREGDSVRASFVPRPEYRGFHDVLHGGVIATALDEILAWTSILVVGSMAVTAKLELKFRSPAPADAEYQLVGRLLEERGRRLLMDARCSVGDTLIAEADALFLTTESVLDQLAD